MAWNLSGKMVETCTCNMFCPCWFGVKELMIMDKGYCVGPILFRIQDGISNGTRVGNFGEIKSQQLRNEAGRAMTVQGAGFASIFQFENDVLTLAPSGTQWSDSDMPHTQVTTRSGAVGKFSWRGN